MAASIHISMSAIASSTGCLGMLTTVVLTSCDQKQHQQHQQQQQFQQKQQSQPVHSSHVNTTHWSLLTVCAKMVPPCIATPEKSPRPIVWSISPLALNTTTRRL